MRFLTITFFLPLALSVNPSTVPVEIPLDSLMHPFEKAMAKAERRMKGTHRDDFPIDFAVGGGCFGGYGRSIPLPSCRVALSFMPSAHPSPSDIVVGTKSPILTLNFYRASPKVWTHSDCVIGVSLLDVPTAKGLYPPLKQAASLITDHCVVRGLGGLVRFAHFEVVVFDARLLPGYERPGGSIFEFSSQMENIPFSTGLKRLLEGHRDMLDFALQGSDI